jgi:hypothetical protein
VFSYEHERIVEHEVGKLEQLSTRVSGLERDLSIWKWVAGISAGVALSALGLAVTALLGS